MPENQGSDGCNTGEQLERYSGSEETVGSVEEMLDNLKRGASHVAVVVVSASMTMVGQASAAHDSIECSVPSQFQPLMSFLHSVTELALLLGIGLGTVGFVIAGIYFMIPGQDANQTGKRIAKNVLLGVVLLLSAQMIMAFLVTQLGGTLCV